MRIIEFHGDELTFEIDPYGENKNALLVEGYTELEYGNEQISKWLEKKEAEQLRDFLNEHYPKDKPHE